MSVPCSDPEFRPVKAKAASLPPGVTAERCWCGRLAKVKQVEDFSDWFGMKFFMCASYEHDPPRSSASSSTRPPSPPPLCKWFHWIDTEQPDWACQEVEEKHRRAWATFFEEERWEKVRANEKAERERQIQKLRAEQARNREVNQKRMDDEAARRFAEEEVRREAREAERKRLRERAAEAQAAEERVKKMPARSPREIRCELIRLNEKWKSLTWKNEEDRERDLKYPERWAAESEADDDIFEPSTKGNIQC
nr:uncharacterized protein LOC127325610 [Lolium perenne]